MKKLVTLCAITFIALNASAQLSSGLVAHWTFNGHTKDVTSNGHHGTPTNITYGKGMATTTSRAAYFNGKSSIISKQITFRFIQRICEKQLFGYQYATDYIPIRL